jgi:hypothetical protein
MGGFSFMEFIREGGWGMWPVLLFGSIAVGAAVRYAIRPSPRALAFTAAMWLTCFVSIGHGMLTNVAAVFSYLEDSARAPDAQFWRILMTGLKEASRPGALGGVFLTLAPLCIAVGLLRGRPND